MNKEITAINVIDESRIEYLNGYPGMNSAAKQQISLYALDEIWKCMVIPAIEMARALDRGDTPIEAKTKRIKQAIKDVVDDS